MNERRTGEQSNGVVIVYKLPHPFYKQFILLKSPRGDWNFREGHGENQGTDNNALKREIFE